MNIIIFAGGAGTRLWPISRKNSPKQFEKLQGDKSTLQLAYDRVADYGADHIYVSTNKNYKNLVLKQLKNIKESNIFTEPARRDLGAAVLLTLLRLKQDGVHGTVGMLWSDHFMDNEKAFTDALKTAEDLIKQDSERFVFLAEKPRFANHNLGWINVGNNIENNSFEFKGWKYRPELEDCKKMFDSGEWFWNPGYFIFDIDFVISLYKKHQPELFDRLSEMMIDNDLLENNYKDLPKISFDEAVVEHVNQDQAVVLKVDMGWSDPGTLYALKEVISESEKHNATKGNVFVCETTDSLVYNEEENKIVTTIGLEGMLVINTKDGLLVCHKDDSHKVKELLSQMEDNGLGKYL